VVVVGEERAVTAAAVVRPTLDDTGAPPAEDSGPGRAEPGGVGPRDGVGVGRIGELDPLPGEVEGDLVRSVVGHAASVGRANLHPWRLPRARPCASRRPRAGRSLWRG